MIAPQSRRHTIAAKIPRQKKEDAIQRMCNMLPATRHEIAVEVAGQMGLSVATLRRWMNELHASGGVHITGWKGGTRQPGLVPIFAAGAGQDLAPPEGCAAKVPPARPVCVVKDEMEPVRIAARDYADKAARHGCAMLNLFFGRPAAPGHAAA